MVLNSRTKISAWVCYLLILIAVVGLSWGGFYYGRARQEKVYQQTFAKAESCFQKQIFDEAEELYHSCADMHPKDLRVPVRLSQLYYATERYDKAISECNEILSRQPNRADAVCRKALCYERQRKWPQAYQTVCSCPKSAKARSMAKRLRGRYELEYHMARSVSGWFPGPDGSQQCFFRKEKSAGICDARGKERFQGSYRQIGPASEKRALYPACTADGEWIFLDADGKRRMVPGRGCSHLGPFVAGYAAVRIGEQYGFLGKSGKPFRVGYDKVYRMPDGSSLVSRFGLWQWIGPDWKLQRQAAFEKVAENEFGEAVQNQILIGVYHGQCYLLHPDGNRCSDFHADEIRFPNERNGLLAFRRGKKWGFVTESGQVVLEPYFEDAKSFSHGYAAVKLNGHWGYLYRDGSIVIPCTFDDAGPMSRAGTAWVANRAGYQLLRLSIEQNHSI